MIPSLQDQRCVDATEGEVVAHDVIGLDVPHLAQIIQSGATGIDAIEIERRRKPVFPHHVDTEPGFQCATSAEGVSDVTLCRTDRNS